MVASSSQESAATLHVPSESPYPGEKVRELKPTPEKRFTKRPMVSARTGSAALRAIRHALRSSFRRSSSVTFRAHSS
jgi:hypothetical protein